MPPLKLSADELSWLVANNVTTIVDLRTAKERTEKPCPLADDSRFSYRTFPISNGARVPKRTDAVAASYMSMVDAVFDDLISFLLNTKSNVLYFCNAGKDRTGVVSAALLYHLGMPHETIVEDYMKSRENLYSMLNNYAAQNPSIDINVITPCEQYIEDFLRWYTARQRSLAL